METGGAGDADEEDEGEEEDDAGGFEVAEGGVWGRGRVAVFARKGELRAADDGEGEGEDGGDEDGLEDAGAEVGGFDQVVPVLVRECSVLMGWSPCSVLEVRGGWM